MHEADGKGKTRLSLSTHVQSQDNGQQITCADKWTCEGHVRQIAQWTSQWKQLTELEKTERGKKQKQKLAKQKVKLDYIVAALQRQAAKSLKSLATIPLFPTGSLPSELSSNHEPQMGSQQLGLCLACSSVLWPQAIAGTLSEVINRKFQSLCDLLDAHPNDLWEGLTNH